MPLPPKYFQAEPGLPELAHRLLCVLRLSNLLKTSLCQDWRSLRTVGLLPGRFFSSLSTLFHYANFNLL